MTPLLKVSLPLHVIIPRKRKDDRKWILNLNNYRNTHYQTLDQAKKIYAEEVMAALCVNGRLTVSPFGVPVELRYTVFPRTKREMDVSNPCSVIDKFACDALVHLGFMPDDNYKHIRRSVYQFGEVDPSNPRCELEAYPA